MTRQLYLLQVFTNNILNKHTTRHCASHSQIKVKAMLLSILINPFTNFIKFVN